MATVLKKRKLNRWDKDSIRPGPVGSVGDVMSQVRLKHNHPDAPIRWDREFTANMAMGSNVQDGATASWQSHGRNAQTVHLGFVNYNSVVTPHGYIIQDVRPVDTTREVFMGSQGRWNWRNQVATAYGVKRTGDQFLPATGEYMLPEGEMSRGGNYPRIVAVAGQQELPDATLRNNTLVGSINESVNPETETPKGLAPPDQDSPATSGLPQVNPPEMVKDLPDDNLEPGPKKNDQRRG